MGTGPAVEFGRPLLGPSLARGLGRTWMSKVLTFLSGPFMLTEALGRRGQLAKSVYLQLRSL